MGFALGLPAARAAAIQPVVATTTTTIPALKAPIGGGGGGVFMQPGSRTCPDGARELYHGELVVDPAVGPQALCWPVRSDTGQLNQEAGTTFKEPLNLRGVAVCVVCRVAP